MTAALAIGSSITVETREDYVPVDNKDLVREYGVYVARLVTRHNRVSSNFDDLLQHVWMKLVENRVIEKHRKSIGHLPKQLTGAQAVAYLRMPWLDFVRRVRRGVMKERLYAKAYHRDGGVCHRCNCDAVKYAAAVERFRLTNPTEYVSIEAKIKAALGLDTIPPRFWVLDGESEGAKTICLFCAKRHGVAAVTFRWYPVPIRGGWASRTALYDRKDVERLKLVMEHEKDRTVDLNADPSSVLSKSLFKQYLARAVHNIYANWCRTRKRRYQEQYKGNDETTGRAWEETLGDPSGARQESIVDLNRVVQYLAGSGDPTETTDETELEVLELFEAGKSVQEVARKMRVRTKMVQSYAV